MKTKSATRRNRANGSEPVAPVQTRPTKWYMCKIAYDHELGDTRVRLFNSMEALKHSHPTWRVCGIVELEIRTKRIVQHGRY